MLLRSILHEQWQLKPGLYNTTPAKRIGALSQPRQQVHFRGEHAWCYPTRGASLAREGWVHSVHMQGHEAWPVQEPALQVCLVASAIRKSDVPVTLCLAQVGARY